MIIRTQRISSILIIIVSCLIVLHTLSDLLLVGQMTALVKTSTHSWQTNPNHVELHSPRNWTHSDNGPGRQIAILQAFRKSAVSRLESNAGERHVDPYASEIARYMASGSKNGMLIWTCHEKPCGGFSDRIRGIIFVFNLAVLMNMHFHVSGMEDFFLMYHPGPAIAHYDKNPCLSSKVYIWMTPNSVGDNLPVHQDVDNQSVVCVESNQIFDPRKYAPNAKSKQAFSQFDQLAIPQAYKDYNNLTVISNVVGHSFHALFQATQYLESLSNIAKVRLGFSQFDQIVAVHLRHPSAEYNRADFLTMHMSYDMVELGIACAQRIEREFSMVPASTGWFIISDKRIVLTPQQASRHPKKLMVMYDSSSAVPGHFEKSQNTTEATMNVARDFHILMDSRIRAIGRTLGGLMQLASAVSSKPIFECCSVYACSN